MCILLTAFIRLHYQTLIGWVPIKICKIKYGTVLGRTFLITMWPCSPSGSKFI